jgi:hypothetical protein
MFWTFFIFPTLLAGNHLLLSETTSFYSAFDFKEKCEYLAWINTVFFQTTFTGFRLLYPMNPYDISVYFLMYTLHDSAHLTFYTRQPVYYVHHAVSSLMAIAGWGLPYHYALAMMNAASFLESSNILLGAVWLLNRAGRKNLEVLGGVATFLYIVLRNVMYPYYLFWHAPRFVAILMSVFIPLNTYWTWKLVRYIRRLGGNRA